MNRLDSDKPWIGKRSMLVNVLFALFILTGQYAAGQSQQDQLLQTPEWNEGFTLPVGVAGTRLLDGVAYRDGFVVGGFMSMAGTSPVGSLAYFDGAAWSGFPGQHLGRINDLHVIEDDLYVASPGMSGTNGTDRLPTLIRWDGQTYELIGEGFDDEVRALATWNGELIAVGEFTSFNGAEMLYAARLTESGWVQLGDGLNDVVTGVSVIDGIVHVVGIFTGASGPDLNGVARLVNGQWMPMGVGFATNFNVVNGESEVSIAEFEGQPVVLGDKNNDGVDAADIYRWEINQWVRINEGSPLYIGEGEILGSIENRLFVDRDMLTDNCFGVWDNNGPVMVDPLICSHPSDAHDAFPVADQVIVVGDIELSADGTPVNHILVETSSGWQPLQQSVVDGNGLNGSGDAVIEFDGRACMRGGFSVAGDEATNGFSCWDGSTWSELNTSPLSRSFSNLETHLIVHEGLMTSISLDGTYQWDGTVWTNMDVDDELSILAAYNVEIFDSQLVVAGVFEIQGVPGFLSMIKWTGAQWVPFEQMLEPFVSGLASFQGNLYATGDFSFSSPIPMGNFARWDGVQWTDLPDELSGFDFCPELLVYDDSLLFGCDLFVESLGVEVSVAQYDGSIWHDLSLPELPGRDETRLREEDGALIASSNGVVYVRKNGAWQNVAATLRGNDNGFIFDLEIMKIGNELSLVLVGAINSVDGVPTSNVAIATLPGLLFTDGFEK